MPSNNVILFDARVDRVRQDTDEIDALARAMAGAHVFTEAWDRYNLKASAQNLRDAADKLDEIRVRLEQPQSRVA